MERLTNEAWRNLDPWECCGQDNYCKRGCHDEGGCNSGCIVPKLYKRLAVLEDAQDWGRMVTIPCKVGDMVYYRKGQYIYGDDVKRIVLDGIDNQVVVDENHCYTFSDFGVKVFLTREEAEKRNEGKYGKTD